MSNIHLNLKLDKSCRGCLSEEGTMISIFQNDLDPQLSKMFENCTSLQIDENDGLSNIICNNCIIRLQESYQFQQICVQSDFTVRSLLRQAKSYLNDVQEIQNLNNSEIETNVAEDEEACLKMEPVNDEYLIESVDDDQNYYQCDLCFEQYKSFASLKQHQVNVHVTNKTCALCKEIFVSADLMMNHSCKEANSKRHSKKYKCKDCDKEYTSSHNLQIHMYTHSGIKPFSCEYCGKSFTKVNSLKSHLSLHTGYLSYLCSECGKGFSTLTGLKRHKTAHTGERPYKCKVCPASFVASGDLNIHMRSHTGEKPYLCPTCGKSFSRVSHLNTHVRIHTGEKPYKCSRCDRGFAQSGDLRSHERIHTGEKPYACTICKKRFAQNGGLASHMRTHTSEKLYRCPTCHKAFSQASSLTRHRRCHNE